MAYEKKELIGVEELKSSLKKACDDIEGLANKCVVKIAVLETLKLLHIIQEQPVCFRASIWECNFHVINFLRKNKQMLQSNNSFDDDVLSAITDALTSALKWKRL